MWTSFGIGDSSALKQPVRQGMERAGQLQSLPLLRDAGLARLANFSHFVVLCSCKTSLQPLLAELVLSLQKLTLPRPAYTSQNILTGESKSTSVVIQTAMLHPSQREGRVGSFNGADSNSRKLQCPFGYLLTDVVDYSMRLTTQSSPTSMCNTFQCSAGNTISHLLDTCCHELCRDACFYC